MPENKEQKSARKGFESIGKRLQAHDKDLIAKTRLETAREITEEINKVNNPYNKARNIISFSAFETARQEILEVVSRYLEGKK